MKKLNSRGVAMLMALVTLTILGILIAQLVYETEVYHRIVYNTVDELRSKILARSALKIALLQIHASDKAKKKSKSFGGAVSNELLDKIWQTPIAFPVPMLPGLGEAEKKALTEFNNSLGLNGRLSANISGESHKLNLNGLVWGSTKTEENNSGSNSGSNSSSSGNNSSANTSSGTTTGGVQTAEQIKQTLEASRKFLTETLEQLIENKKRDDDKFRDRYSNLKAEVLILNLLAWMDPETATDGEGRPKDEYYQRLQPRPLSIKNAPLQSLTELHQVKDFSDDIVKIIEGSFTVLTTGGLNINTASIALVQSLLPELSPVDVEKLLERRTDEAQGGPFKNADDFWQAAGRYGNIQDAKERFAKNKINISTDETAYRVILESNSGNSNKTWVAYVGPPPPLPAAAGTSTDPNAINTNGLDITADANALANSANRANSNTTKNDNKIPDIIYLKAE